MKSLRKRLRTRWMRSRGWATLPRNSPAGSLSAEGCGTGIGQSTRGLLVDLEVALGGGLDAEAARVLERGGAEGRPFARIPEQPQDSPGEGAGIVADEQAVDTVPDHRRRSVSVYGDDRQSRRFRLDDHQTLGVRERGKRQHRGIGV